MCRRRVLGPFSDLSLTKFGRLQRDAEATEAQKSVLRLHRQHHIVNEPRGQTREKRYALCTKCGGTTMVVNFDCVPSARLGLWGQCAEGRDYTHHRFVPLQQTQYRRVLPLSAAERLNWWHFEAGT